MKISVVIPAFNEERLLGQTLAAVRAAMTAFAPLGWKSELIVCDNNSTDRTAEVARAAGAIVAFEPINQIGRARNCGAAAATGDWLVFVDADSQPTAALFADVAQHIQTGKYIAGGSTVRLDGNHRAANAFTKFWNFASRTKRVMAGSFIFCETAAFRQIGGFSKELFAAEEIDLSQRLKKLGRATGRKLVILHRHPLLTSARKVHLYSGRELAKFFLRAVILQRKTLTNREACHPWYDGRR